MSPYWQGFLTGVGVSLIVFVLFLFYLVWDLNRSVTSYIRSVEAPFLPIKDKRD